MKRAVAILGASGMVGQTALALLADHPLFEIGEVCASAKRIGDPYTSVSWKVPYPYPKALEKLNFSAFDDLKSPYVISALPSESAREVEPMLIERGHKVFSNASPYRLHAMGQLIVPEVNLARLQEARGKIVTNPNCVVSIVSLALAPLFKTFSLKHVTLTTLQSLSGAGYNGVSACAIMDNCIPNIDGEEEKIATELENLFFQHDTQYSVQVNRVPVQVGHGIACFVEFNGEAPSYSAVINAWQTWSKEVGNCIHLYSSLYAPQPRQHLKPLDMDVHIGRIELKHNRLKFFVLGDNLARGAAGATLTNLVNYLQLHGD